MKLYCTFVNLHPDLHAQHLARLRAGQMAILPYQRTRIATDQFGSGLTDLNFDKCFVGAIPHIVFVVLVDRDAIDGHVRKNPFYFDHFNTTEVSLRLNNTTYPQEPYVIDYNKNKYARIYKALIDAIWARGDNGSLVELENFKFGYNIFAFDLNPDKCGNWHGHDLKTGVMDVKFKLPSPITKPVQMFVFGVDNTALQLDQFGSATVTIY